MYMYFTKIISRNFIIVEGYEDEVLSRGFSFFVIAVFRKYCILFTRRKVKFHVVFDRKNNNNNTTYWRRGAYYVL